MPAYCPHGRILRAWQRQIDANFDDTYDARSRAMDDIDDALNAVIVTPFHAWLRVIGTTAQVFRLSQEDGDFLSIGDVVGLYDNTNKVLKPRRVTVAQIETQSDGLVAVTYTGTFAVADNDEVAVVWTHEAGGRTLTVVGPPREVQSRAVALARYYALGDITDLDEPPDTLGDAYVAATEWLAERGSGRGRIRGATYRGVSASATRMEHHPAIDVDDPEHWDEDEDLILEIGQDRL